jgi:Zn-dependent peptidase ImmA (M78 family)
MGALEHTTSPEYRARELLRDLRISGYPVNPIAVAGSLSLEVRFERLDSVEGMLIRGPKSGYVIVSRDAIRPRANFTIAHEIGHFVMHKGGKYICSIDDIESLAYDKSEESEASVFASELLLPSHLFAPDVGATDVSLTSFSALARKYDVSLTCVSIRYIKACSDIAALVMTKGERIRYRIPSRDFRFRIRSGRSPVDRSTLLSSPNRTYKRTVPADMWLEQSPVSEVHEESLYMLSWDQTLTLITVPDDELYDVYDEIW